MCNGNNCEGINTEPSGKIGRSGGSRPRSRWWRWAAVGVGGEGHADLIRDGPGPSRSGPGRRSGRTRSAGRGWCRRRRIRRGQHEATERHHVVERSCLGPQRPAAGVRRLQAASAFRSGRRSAGPGPLRLRPRRARGRPGVELQVTRSPRSSPDPSRPTSWDTGSPSAARSARIAATPAAVLPTPAVS